MKGKLLHTTGHDQKKKEKGIWKNGKLEHKSRIMKENSLAIQAEKANHWEKKKKSTPYKLRVEVEVVGMLKNQAYCTHTNIC